MFHIYYQEKVARNISADEIATEPVLTISVSCSSAGQHSSSAAAVVCKDGRCMLAKRERCCCHQWGPGSRTADALASQSLRRVHSDARGPPLPDAAPARRSARHRVSSYRGGGGEKDQWRRAGCARSASVGALESRGLHSPARGSGALHRWAMPFEVSQPAGSHRRQLRADASLSLPVWRY
jgi:hypothetical protein